MTKDRRGLVRAGLLGLLMVFLLAQPGFAYLGQTKYSVTVSAESAVVRCGKNVQLTVTVLKVTTNSPIKNENVRWEIKSSPSQDDRLTQTITRTNSQGRANVILKLADEQGVRVIKAIYGGASGTTTITCEPDDLGHKSWTPRLHWSKVPKWLWLPIRDYGPFWLSMAKGWR